MHHDFGPLNCYLQVNVIAKNNKSGKKTLPKSFISSMSQLLLIGSQIGYHIFEYKHKKLIQKSRDLLGGKGGHQKIILDHRGGGFYWGPKKDYMIFLRFLVAWCDWKWLYELSNLRSWKVVDGFAFLWSVA